MSFDIKIAWSNLYGMIIHEQQECEYDGNHKHTLAVHGKSHSMHPENINIFYRQAYQNYQQSQLKLGKFLVRKFK